jgi:hypothetical protein
VDPVTGAWEKYLEHVSDKDLGKVIGAWERALLRYRESTFPYESLTRALTEAYALRDRREHERATTR